jgi:hypothetical protein
MKASASLPADLKDICFETRNGSSFVFAGEKPRWERRAEKCLASMQCGTAC